MTDFLESLTVLAVDKEVTVKGKLLADLELQKRCAQAEVDGVEFTPDPEAKRGFSKWYFYHDHAWWSYLRVGHTMLRIKGGNGFKAGENLTDLIAWYEETAKIVRMGVLDLEIKDAMERRKQPFKGGRKRVKLVA